MINKENFDDFLSNLQATSRNLGFFVDWQKCLSNKDKISIYLNHLNFLLGKKDLKNAIYSLYDEMPKAFNVLNLLIAIRNKDKNNFVVNANNEFVTLKSYFKSKEQIFEFVTQSGLDKIFVDSQIKDLNDFVFGIEVGLDTNARKNRSGKIMENVLANIFSNENLDFKEQVSIKDFKDLKQAFGDDIKKFDFVIKAQNKTYFIECNFYCSGGSKLNKVARAYQEMAPRFEKFSNYEFVWITDGRGWMDAKSKLSEAYKVVEIYNLSNLNNFISKIKNG